MKVNGHKRNRSASATKGGSSNCRPQKPCSVGSYRQVFHGSAIRTSGGLSKSDIMMNKRGRLVSKKKHKSGLKIFKKYRRNLMDNQHPRWKKGHSKSKKAKKSSKKSVASVAVKSKSRKKKCPPGSRRNRKTGRCRKI
jgi:hypothetical protein